MVHTVIWIDKPWGILPHKNGQFSVVFGDDEMVALSGVYANKRIAKKQITHYITKGFPIGSFHGAYKKLKNFNFETDLPF